MKQLELKHLCAYLPYGLKAANFNVKHFGLDKPLVKNIEPSNITTLIDFDPIYKPILYPLDYLTKEITHNGETFVPIERLFEKNYPANKSKTYYYDTQINYIRCSHVSTSYHKLIYIVSELAGRNSYEDMQQLIEWRFDVFNLIEDGLAIPVTEDFNPYK